VAGAYKRVLLKLSGEAFCKQHQRGLDLEEVDFIADEIIEAAKLNVQIAVVVGGGNFVRGNEVSISGVVTPATADYMGMLATLLNALALQDTLESKGMPTRVLSAIPVHSVAEPFIRRRAIRHLEKGRIVILSAGTGSPHFTTDTAAALRATEISAQILLKATKVEGVYDQDPALNPDAHLYHSLTYLEFLNKRLGIMDSTAISMCMEYHLPVVIFNLRQKGNIPKVIAGKRIGTFIGSEKKVEDYRRSS
jgi:uridylate kinase